MSSTNERLEEEGFTFADSLRDIEAGNIINRDRLVGVEQQEEVEEALQLCVKASLDEKDKLRALTEQYHIIKRRSLIFESKRRVLVN